MSEKIEYDFRDGLDHKKMVYKKSNRCSCGEFWGYLGYLLATWIWAAGWFALFFYAWMTDREATFITFIVVWMVFMLGLIFGFVVPNLVRNHKKQSEKKRLKRLEKEEKERKLREALEGKGGANREEKNE